MATNINTILNWFKTGLKPTQEQFWTTWASFWHKDEQIPQSSISGLENTLNTKAEKSQLEAHINNKKAHADLFDNKADIIHTHRIIDIQDLENTLNEKALIKHKHEITDIQNLESALDEKALLSHTHEITNIQNLESALDGKALITHTHEIVDIEDLEKTLNEKALLSHTHEITEIEGLKDQLNTKLTATLATDSETQIDTNISEDNKVISRLKLFNWWNWIKSKTQTISGSWNFTNGLKAEVSVDLKEPTSQKGISMVKDGLKFWFTEVINSLLKTNPSSTGISTVLMPEMQNGETKTLATLDDLNSSSQDLAKTLSSGNTANNEIFLSDGLSSTILAVGTVGVGDPTGKFVTITPNKLSVTEAFTDRELSITSTDIVHKSEDLSVMHTLNWDESVNGDYTQTFQAKSGEIALLSDITTEPHTLTQILSKGNTADMDIQITDGFSLSTTIDKGMVGVGDASGKFTTITPSGISIREHMDTDRELLISSTNITHKNENSSVNYTLNWDESVNGNYAQTFQAKSGKIAMMEDITMQKIMDTSNGLATGRATSQDELRYTVISAVAINGYAAGGFHTRSTDANDHNLVKENNLLSSEGTLRITEMNSIDGGITEKLTVIEVETPIANSTIKFPAPKTNGNYTLATEENITLQKTMDHGSFWSSDPTGQSENISAFSINSIDSVSHSRGMVLIVADDPVEGFSQILAAPTGLFISIINNKTGGQTYLDFQTRPGKSFVYRPDYNKPSGTYTFVTTDDLPIILSESATLTFPNIAAGSTVDLTITVIGASVGDVVSLGLDNASMLPGIQYTAWVSATNTVTVRCANIELSTSRAPAPGIFKIKVFK